MIRNGNAVSLYKNRSTIEAMPNEAEEGLTNGFSCSFIN